MIEIYILALSITLQFLAAFLALRLISITGRRIAWILVSAALLLMAVRRSITLIRVLSGDAGIRIDPAAEIVALVISVLMLAGVSMIGPIFMERKKIEQALRESEYRLRRFYESGMIGVIYWNMDGKITEANDKFLEMTGYSRHELEYGEIDWLNMTPEEFRYLDERSVKELKETGVNRVPFEKEYFRKDGSRLPILLAGATLDEKRFNGVAFIIDITDRKQAEAELRKSEELYRTLFKNMLNGFAYCKMLFEDGKPHDYIYLAVNDAFESQTGLKDVVGRKVTEIIPGIREADPRLFEVLGRVAMTGQPEQFEIFLKAWQNWFMLSVYSPAHEHFVAVFDVITERKQADKKMAEQLHELQRWHEVMLDRADRVMELKREVNELLARGGQPPRYSSAVEGGER